MLLYEFSPDEEREFFKFLTKYMDEEDLLALKETLGEDLYFILFLLAGKTIEFPERVTMEKKIKTIKRRLYGKVKRGKLTGNETDS